MNMVLKEGPKLRWPSLNMIDDAYTPNSLPQKLSKAVPYGSQWVVEANDFCGSSFIVCAGEPLQLPPELILSMTRSVGSTLDLTSADVNLMRAYIAAYNGRREFPFWAKQGCVNAGLTVTYWGNADDRTPWDPIDSALVAGPNARYANVRMCLQKWFDASIDELAALINLSPTTLINLAKPSHIVRPKTVRKMMVVYGLMSEFVRVVGADSALAWARTVGYRLLSEGNLRDFEQFVATRIFPTADRTPRDSRLFGNSDFELEIKPTEPIGRPSRI